MQVTYNLRYQKSNFSNKKVLDKEGEIVIYAKGFRLKGKGAGDKGELINFSEIKEFYFRNEKLIFVTFSKEKYVLSDSGTLFDQMMIDIYKARNEFLMDALFMRGGKMRAEFEGDFQRVSKFGKAINKGNAKFRLYENSMVVLPKTQDAFAVRYDFISFHEFEDMEYSCKIVMDDGSVLHLSRLGNDFDLFQERFNEIFGEMFEVLVNRVLRGAFPEFHAATLLKFAYKAKGGKAVAKKDLVKIDADLAAAVEDFIFSDESFKEKTEILRELTNDYEMYYGVAMDKAVADEYIKWVMFAIPSKNVVAFCVLPRWKEGASLEQENAQESLHDTYFFRIIMEKGSPADKVEDKVKEVDFSLVSLGFAKDPCYKDKRDLRHSPFQYAIRKMPPLRILRKSYVGRAAAADVKDWQKQVEDIFAKSKLKN